MRGGMSASWNVKARSGAPASATPSAAALALSETYGSRFIAEMDDDFNTPAAIGQLFDFCREINKHLDAG
ncbi:MAG TPA: hypothetical protein P5076_04175, partial [Myxococcota bacterium]|nr:hypothetical protein [Myxococcota bacterium]